MLQQHLSFFYCPDLADVQRLKAVKVVLKTINSDLRGTKERKLCSVGSEHSHRQSLKNIHKASKKKKNKPSFSCRVTCLGGWLKLVLFLWL